jgi:PAS domain S-box-containing protein
VNERLLILVLTAAANVLLGLAVWLKNPSESVNRYFGLLSLSLASWTLSNGFVSTYAGTEWGIFAARAAFASASAIPLCFFLFVSVFPSPHAGPSRRAKLIVLVASSVALLLSLTPLIAQRTASVDDRLQMYYGPLHPLFAAYLVAGLTYSLFLLARKRRSARGIERLQIRYVFLGIFLTALGGTITNLLIPLLFASSRFSPYGPVFSLVMITVFAHSIVRYRVMNVRLVIRQSVTYIASVAIAAAAFVSLAGLASILFASQTRDLSLWTELTLAFSVALLFQPLKRAIQAWVDRYVFREAYDYQRTVREISRAMGTMLNLESLVHYACNAIGKTVRPEFVAVYALDTGGILYKPLAARRDLAPDPAHEADSISAAAAIPTLLSHDKRPLLLDEVKKRRVPPGAERIEAELALLHAELVLPIVHEDRVTGFFLLGSKLSGDPYFSEDIDLLTTLSVQAAIAIQNAQLYSQVVLINEYIENILETIDSAVIAVSGDGVVTLFNSAAARLTGIDPKDIKGTSFQALPATLAAPLSLTLNDSSPRTQVETIIEGRAGRRTPVICSTSPLNDRERSILGAVAVFSDLTLLKRLESEKQQAERLASIGALASGIAHEIKNPLVAIKTFAELLPERFTEEDFRNDFLRVVIGEIDRIDDLVARLRGLATRPTRPLTPLNVKAPIEDTLALLRGQLEQSRITVRLELEPVLPLIAGDAAQLKQLFLNLVVNALEAMKPGGRLLIRASENQASDARTVLVEVIDSGSGISERLLAQIFEPFVTSKPRGSGLGLSICRGIADAHRATIRARNNQPGQGATLSIEFPVATDAPISAQH